MIQELPIAEPVSRGARRIRTAQAGSARAPLGKRAEAGTAARELDAEVARLLRVRRGELAEPLGWHRPWLRLRVAAVLSQLEPIRTHAALVSSWEREAHRGPDVRLAYATASLAIDHRIAAARARRRRSRSAFSAITSLG